MRELTTRADRTVDAPARDFWAYRLDFLRLPEYNAAVREVERTDSGRTNGEGATYRFELSEVSGELERVGANLESKAARSLDGGGDHG